MSLNPVSVVNSDNLKAFQSGIGSGLDLKIEKQIQDDHEEMFNAVINIQGLYEQQIKEYLHQPFQYRVKATGDKVQKTSEGFVVLQTEASQIYPVSFTAIKYFGEDVTIKVRLKFKVEYYVRTSTGLEVKSKTMYTDPINYTYRTDSQINVSSGASVGVASVQDVKLSEKTIMQLADERVRKDSEIIQTIHKYGAIYHSYEIEDDYEYGLDTPYYKGAPRTFKPTSHGSIHVNARMVNGEIDDSSYLSISGYANAGLFYAVEKIEKTVNINNGTSVQLFKVKDLNKMTFKNADDKSYTKDSGDNRVRYNISDTSYDNTSCTLQIHPNVSMSNVENTIVSVTINGQRKSVQTRYRFDDVETFITIPYHRIIPSLGEDVLTEYHFKTTVVNCSSNIFINGSKVSAGAIIQKTASTLSTMTILSEKTDYTVKWEMVLPDPDANAPFSGSVNGGNYLVNDGKKNYEAYMPVFPIPLSVGNVRFEVLLESIGEDETPVKIRFEKERAPGIGYENGGLIIFSSDLVGYRNRQFEHTVSQSTVKNLALKGLGEQSFPVTVYKDTESHFVYHRYEVKIESTNNDVSITKYPQDIQFENGESQLTFSARIQQNAVSKWSPQIHSGYYYLNQHEHYLPAEFDVQTDYGEGTQYQTEEFKAKLRAEFIKSTANKTTTCRLEGEHDYKNSSDRFAYFDYEMLTSDDGNEYWVSVKPYIDTEHYKEYSSVEYLSPIKTLPDVMEVWDEIRWEQQLSSNERISVYARVYDLIRSSWSDWVQITSGGKPNLVPSNFIQFKIETFFNQTVSDPIEITEAIATSTDFRRIMSDSESRNVRFDGSGILPLNDTVAAEYVTTVVDYGTPVSIQFGSQAGGNGNVARYIAYSNDPRDLASPKWMSSTDETSAIEGYRYFKYKFHLSPGSTVHSVRFTIGISPLEDACIKFGNFSIKGKTREASKQFPVLKDYTFKLKMDGKPHVMIEDVEAELSKHIEDTEYTMDDLYLYQFESGNPSIELSYSHKELNEPLVATSIESRTNPSHAPYVKFKNQKAVLEAIPQQFSPIIVQHDTYGALREVMFVTDGEPGLVFKKTMTSDKDGFIKLEHENVDRATIRVTSNGEVISDWVLHPYQLEVHHPYLEVELSYKLQNSFVAIVDEEEQNTTIIVHTPTNIQKAKVSFETSQVTNKRILKHLSLNPIYNTEYEGFIFLSNQEEEPKRIEIHANPTVIKPRETDHITLYIKVVDKYGNPVQGEVITTNKTVGVLDVIQNVTDQNGVAVFRYNSPRGTGYESIRFSCQNGIHNDQIIRIANPTR